MKYCALKTKIPEHLRGLMPISFCVYRFEIYLLLKYKYNLVNISNTLLLWKAISSQKFVFYRKFKYK